MRAEPEFTHPAATSLVERLRAVHLQMLDAVLTGDGLAAVAELAAGAAGGAGGVGGAGRGGGAGWLRCRWPAGGRGARRGGSGPSPPSAGTWASRAGAAWFRCRPRS